MKHLLFNDLFIRRLLKRHIPFGLRQRIRRIYERYGQNFAFVHITKTGGMSIRKALHVRGPHRTALELRAELGEKLWSRKFSFAFVRNPWDRAVSHYHYGMTTSNHVLSANPIAFNAWVKRVYRDNDPIYSVPAISYLQQYDWLADKQGQIIVDFVGRFEQLPRDFEVVCKQINRTVVLPHLNSSEHQHYRTYYDAETRQIVGDWFNKDIAYFGYQF